MLETPDIDRLLACARRLAQLLDLPSPADVELRRATEAILFERRTAAAVDSGIITRTELRDYLLAHLQTLICDSARVAEPVDCWRCEDLLGDIEFALFGETGAG